MPYKLTTTVSETDKHTSDVTALVYRNEKLYSGGDDGKIKVWNAADLELEKTIDAHRVNVYSLAVDDKCVYSCSNDNTIKWWDVSSLSCAKTLTEEDEIVSLYYCDESKYLYSGSSAGVVKVWDNGDVIGRYSIMEELHGICAKRHLLFTAGTMDVVVTEMIPGHKDQYTTRRTYNGRGPMYLLNNAVCYLHRDGRVITAFEASLESGFKELCKLEGHVMIVNALSGSTAGSTPLLYSGGYDGELKVWDMNTYKAVDKYTTGKCINAIASGGKSIYVGGANGFIEKLDPQ